jgi:hypothetical protein
MEIISKMPSFLDILYRICYLFMNCSLINILFQYRRRGYRDQKALIEMMRGKLDNDHDNGTGFIYDL